MKRQYQTGFLILCLILALAVSPAAVSASALAEAMLLTRCEGEVSVLDADGLSRAAGENTGLVSGDTVVTGPGAEAAIALDSTKTVMLDGETRLQVLREGDHLLLRLESGLFLLNVTEKIGAGESLRLDRAIKNIDVAFVFTDVLSHKMYYRMMNTLRNEKIPFHFLHSQNTDKVFHTLYEACCQRKN